MEFRYTDDVVKRIIEASISEFADGKFQDATIRQISAKAGIAQATIYKYFKGKEDLPLFIAEQVLQELTIRLREHLLGIKGTLNKIRKMTWFFLNFFDQEKELAWVINLIAPGNGLSNEGVWEETRKHGEILQNILKEGQKTGEVKTDLDLKTATLIYFGAMNRKIILGLLNANKSNLTNEADSIADLYFDAIKMREEKVHFECPFAMLKENLNSHSK